MSTGRINSEESIRTAERMLRAFNGSWRAVERAATVDEDGVYVVRRRDAPGYVGGASSDHRPSPGR